MKKLMSVLLAVSALMLSGCATIMGEKTQALPLATNPEGAHFKIIDEKGHVFQEGTTPTTVILPKHDGSYFGKKSYVIHFSKEGYRSTSVPLQTNANGKYIIGNLFFGGLAGYLLVDPFNGGMYDISPISVTTDLDK